MSSPAYQRVILKLSGEALLGPGSFGIDPKITTQIAEEIAAVHRLGVEVAVVIGGGKQNPAAQANEIDDHPRPYRR